VVDLHAHILPGLDDGPTCAAEALALCRLAAEDGATVMVATPHMNDGVYHVCPEDVFRGMRELQAQLDAGGLPLKILPGADVRADGDLADRVRGGELLTVAGGGKYLMVELSPDVIPPRLAEAFFELQLMGVTPIITHPERNVGIQERPGSLDAIVRAGNLVQVTAASLTGGFGERALHCANALLERRLVHLVASDAHSAERRPPGLSRARATVAAAVGEAEAAQIFDLRPRQIIAGEPVEAPEPLDREPRGAPAMICFAALRRSVWPW
jgi:protein-tyrosine phosphatase